VKSTTADDGESTALTPFQVEVAQRFFTLPESVGFLLAGGAALLAQHLIQRPTRDLDFFTRPGAGDVPAARDAVERAAPAHGWTVDRIQDSPTFCRMLVHGPEDLLVDLALDAPPGQPPEASFVGPTFAPEELAGRKLLALFDRAEARDFADVYTLAELYGKDLLLTRAADLDEGFDHRSLAAQFATLSRFNDTDLPVEPADVAAVRAFFASWRSELLG